MAFPKVRESVGTAMAPVKRVATKAEAEAEKIVEQGYIQTEFRIPVPQNALTKLMGMPKVFVLGGRIYLGGRDPDA